MYANKLEALFDYRDTLLRVRNEGLEFNMNDWINPCGTVACVAGWHAIFAADCIGTVKDQSAMVVAGSIWAGKFSENWGSSGSKYRQKVYGILFSDGRGWGSSPDQQIIKQLKAVNWFIHREEALIEYQRLRAMPRKERRRLKLAA